jgi:hypothetical protein
MERQYEQFVSTLYKFVYDLDRYHTTKGTSEIVGKFKFLNMNKVMLKFYRITKDNIELIKNKNDKLFDNSFLILPDVDMGYYWKVLTDNQKKKIWVYINILYTICDMILYIKNDCTDNTINKFINKNTIGDKETKKTFDPYIGVGEDTVEYSVDDVCAGDCDKVIARPEESTSPIGLSSLMGMVGMNNILNLDEIRNQLKNLSSSDIKGMTEKISDMLENDDSQTINLITSILENIKESFGEGQSLSSNPMEDISKIANNIVNKIKPEVENGNIDFKKILESTKKMSEKYNSQGLFPNGFNPFNLLNKLMSNNNNNISEKEYITELDNMCGNLGINKEDLSKLTPDVMQNLMSKLNKNNK